MHRVTLLALSAVFAAVAFGRENERPTAPPPRAVIDFARDVRPILAKHCYGCHGPQKQRGGLRLDRRADALKGGDSGKAIVPGKPGESLLLRTILSADDAERMPQGAAPLSPADVRTLTAWIEAGAKWPAEGTAARHWAFEPVKRPPVPKIAPGAPVLRNDIDRFVAAKLADNGLSLSGDADRRTLIRRLKFDLIGLPPTPEEVEAFVADKAPDAYEKLADRYLASPQFGERWARHWLDVVRFAESNGFETNQPRRTAYHYRDYVVQSFNDDKPYNLFVKEQLAGDALGADAATGFLVAGPWDEVKSPDVTLTLNQRADELHDMTATTGSAFLGLTVGCARCHAHKFDPISQLDYYHVKAVFAGVRHGERALRAAETVARKKEAERLRTQLGELEAKLASLEPFADPGATEARRATVNPRLNSERFKPVKAKYLRFVVFQTTDIEPCVDELEVFTAGPEPVNVARASEGAKATSSGNYPGSEDRHRLAFVHDGQYGNGRSWISNKPGRGWVQIEFVEPALVERVVWSRDREGKYLDRLATRYRIDVSTDRENWVVVASSDDRAAYAPSKGVAAVPPALTSAERAEWLKLAKQFEAAREALTEFTRGQLGYVGKLGAPEMVYRLHRGDVTQAREVVQPGALESIGPRLEIPAGATDPERRLALAKWVVDPRNPLTARVIVNRLWQHHFGAGIVDTPSDFGRNGAPPTHPELLDWLASELANPGRKAGGEAKPWSLKHIHRLIVTSAAYRQSSAHRPDAGAKDAQSRLLWRFPPRRLEAEAIRDSILFVSGKLDLTMGGPGFDLFEPNTNYVKVYAPKKEFGPAEFRRMIYQQKPRMQLDDTFGAFDCPDAGQIAPKRNVSVTPLQALNLLNSPFALQQAKFFAARVEKDAGARVPAQVRRAFELAVQRPPTEQEAGAALKLVNAHGLAALCRALLNANEFAFVD